MFLKKFIVLLFVLVSAPSISRPDNPAPSAPVSLSPEDVAMEKQYGKDFVSFFDKKSQKDVISLDDPKGKDFEFNNQEGKKSGICLDLICAIENKDISMSSDYDVYVTFKRISKKTVYTECGAVTFIVDPPLMCEDTLQNMVPHEISVTFHPVSSGTPVLELRPRGKGYALVADNVDVEPNEYLDAIFQFSDLDRLIKAKKITLKFCDESIVFDERHMWILRKFDQEIYKILTERFHAAHKVLLRKKTGCDEFIQDSVEKDDKKYYDILIQ